MSFLLLDEYIYGDIILYLYIAPKGAKIGGTEFKPLKKKEANLRILYGNFCHFEIRGRKLKGVKYELCGLRGRKLKGRN